MSDYTVVAIEPGFDNMLLVKVIKAPHKPDEEEEQEAAEWKRFVCDPDTMPPWTEDEAVRAHGRILWQKLTTETGWVAKALARVLETDTKKKHAVYFQVPASVAERLRWEALWHDKKEFLALDRRWPIGRIADSGVVFHPPSYTFTPPLRVMALMSALGVKAKLEWKNLYGAVANARENGLPVKLKVFVGEEDLLHAIQDGMADGTVTGVEASGIPKTSTQIEGELEDFAPHILHFFCHGSAALGKPQLELATIADQDLDESSVILPVKKLAQFSVIRDVWLITLNCCEGGTSVGQSHSMAYQLVAEGVPAAVGMLEPIDASDAHAFCGAFYDAVFRTVRRLLAESPPGNVGEIEWVEALYPPRETLSQAHKNPLSRPEWTLPVLYVRPERFQVKLESAPVTTVPPQVLETMKLQAEAVAATLRGLSPDAPEEVRDQILAIVAGFPPALQPDRNGRFPGEI